MVVYRYMLTLNCLDFFWSEIATVYCIGTFLCLCNCEYWVHTKSWRYKFKTAL